MSVEAITEALHEHMYEKLNDSPETEEEKKIRYLNKRKAKNHKEQTDKPTKFKKWVVTDAEPRTGQDSMNVRPEGRNAQSSKRSVTMQNVAEQIRK